MSKCLNILNACTDDVYYFLLLEDANIKLKCNLETSPHATLNHIQVQNVIRAHEQLLHR